MPESSDLTFNIIYTPGTVRYLQLFVFSLLKWLDCSFRLVANGCSTQEKHLLWKLCQNNARLEFLPLPGSKMLTHDQVLSYLHCIEQSDTFCFMDSDILATGDFISELTAYLPNYAGVFSGSPVYSKDDDRILTATHPNLSGRFSHTDTGLCLGSSYLAMYDNQKLRQVLHSTGIGFGRYHWTDVPVKHQNWLSEMGMKKTKYDTGKLLNLVFIAQKERLILIESPFLQHIGGISIQTIRGGHKQEQKNLRERLTSRAFGRRLKQLVQTRGIRQSKTQSIADIDTRLAITAWKIKRGDVSNYFIELLRALFENRQLPAIPRIGDPEIEENIKSVTSSILILYYEFEGQLAY